MAEGAGIERRATGRDLRLAGEFALVFIGLPLVMALRVPPAWLWPVMLGLTGAAALLLSLTPGFRWRALGVRRVDWPMLAAVAALTAVVCTLLVWWLLPGRFLALPRRSPETWLVIMALYPFLSALPQELIFRALYFGRYRGLFASERQATVVNALVFGLAHLMFWNWIAVTLTVAGGALFAVGYLRQGFVQAVLLHAVCGAILFTSGLGTFFYHGAVG
jgi:membrane protease YdiL (CAAX protease family)